MHTNYVDYIRREVSFQKICSASHLRHAISCLLMVQFKYLCKLYNIGGFTT